MENKLETSVGVFLVIGFLSFVLLALQLGDIPLLRSSSTYIIEAEFDNVSGLKKGSKVQIAGVAVGDVADIYLREDYAVVELRLKQGLEVPIDSIASVRTIGIIGDKFVQISLGGDGEYLNAGGVLTDTESTVDIESLISKFAFGSAE